MFSLNFIPCPLTAAQGRETGPTAGFKETKSRAEEADHWNKEGLRLFGEGKFTQAAEAFEKVYQLFPDIPDVSYNLGLAQQRAGKFEGSIPPLQKSLTLRANDPAARRALGASLLQINRTREGAEQLEKSLEHDPANVDALYYLAMAYFRLEQPGRAEQCLRWMFERNPDSPLLHLRTGNVLGSNRKFREAIAELKKAAALDPNLPDVYLQLGMAYIGMKDAQAAQEAIEEEVRRHPGSAEAYLVLGELLLFVKRDITGAIASIRRAQELGIDPAKAEFDLGDAYIRLGQTEDAEKHLKVVVKLDPNHRRAHYLLGKIYQRQGNKLQAREHFATADSLAKQEHGELVTSFRTIVEKNENPE